MSPVLAFGIPGPRTLALVLMVATALYGRNASRLLLATRYGRSLSPWLRLLGVGAPARGRAATPPPPSSSSPCPPSHTNRARGSSLLPRRRGKVFWAFALTGLAALAAWVATRMMIPHALSSR